MESIGGYLWLLITVVMVAVLAGALLWGTHRWRHKRRDWAAKQAERHAVKRVYREDDRG
jgi:type II secretory pathway pseudopilin PulG